jgi:hypothetical protein
VPNPDSRRYVINLDNWYSQSHPVEDFAETFAVWLRPGGRWRRRYAGWPVAMRKLRFVDALMQELRDAKPVVRTRERPDSLSRLRFTLRDYYERKESSYEEADMTIYDRDLRRVFSEPDGNRRRLAAAFLRKHRRALRERVAQGTGQYAFVVDAVLKALIVRTRELGLRLSRPEQDVLPDAAIVLTLHTMRYVRRRHREYFR